MVSQAEQPHSCRRLQAEGILILVIEHGITYLPVKLLEGKGEHGHCVQSFVEAL